MAGQISGYRMYRTAVIAVKMQKRRTLRPKKTYDIYCTAVALYGRLCNRMETMPVPIMTENHLSRRHRVNILHKRFHLGMRCIHTME